MDAYQMTHALLQFSADHFGLKVYDHTRLESVKYAKNKNFATVDTRAVIECNTIIYATGYESHELIRNWYWKIN